MKDNEPISVSKCCNSTVRANEPVTVEDIMNGYEFITFSCVECGELIDMETDVIFIAPYINVSKGVFRKNKKIKNLW